MKTDKVTPSESGERKSPEDRKEAFKEIFKQFMLSYPAVTFQHRHVDKLFQIADEYASQETALAIQPLLERIKILEGQNEWISVEDSLPDESKTVLVSCFPGFLMHTCFYSNGNWIVSSVRATNDPISEVTHWKPLPIPPINL